MNKRFFRYYAAIVDLFSQPFFSSISMFIHLFMDEMRRCISIDYRLVSLLLLVVLYQSPLSYATLFAIEQSKNISKLHKIYIPRQDAASALNLLAEQTDSILLFNYQQAKTKQAKPIVGHYTLMQALRSLLEDSGLVAELTEQGILKISVVSQAEKHPKPVSIKQSVENEKMASAASNEKSVEVINITGIRYSLIKSINHKRLSHNIVDSISAEDVGKFPDANIAESLQRITGVSIDRSGGEGRFITIRGLGPEFNSVLFNGRALATDTEGRSFSLDTLASETINTLDVYKSGQALLSEDSIGGLININSAKPFDHSGFRLSSTIKALHTDSSDKTEPQFSILLSDTFFADNLGILASFNHQHRTQVNKAVINFQNVVGDMTLAKGPLFSYLDDELRMIENVTRAQSLDRNVMTEERERNSGTVVVQYQANNDLLFTLDGLYSKFDVKASGYTANTWFWNPTGAYLDPVGGKEPVLDSAENRNIIFFQHGATSISSAYREQHRPSDLSSIGLNIDWQMQENLNLNSDVFWSNARNRNRGYDRQILVESDGLGYVEYDYLNGGEHPALQQGQNTLPSVINLEQIFPAHVEARGNYIDAENIGAKFDFTWYLDHDLISKTNFGLHYSIHKKNNIEYRENETSGTLYKNYARTDPVKLSIPKSLLELKSLGGNWRALSDLVHGFQSVDDYIAWLEQPSTLAQLNAHPDIDDAVNLFTSNGGLSPQVTDNAYQVEETITALYGSANFTFELADMPLEILAGLRYTHTDLVSSGTILQLYDLVHEVDNPNSLSLDKVFASNAEAIYVEKNNQYHHLLPSVIANLSIFDKLLFRAAISKTLSRPTLDDVAPWFSYGETHVITGNQALASNPDLTPYLATNFDLSLEWYYDNASLFSLAAFYKDVDDWIVRSKTTIQQRLATSTYQTFIVDQPQNIETIKISGFEFNWTHSFPSGLGFQVNATLVDSNATLITGSLFALEGLSDSANMTLFYQGNGIQVRLAYNWRDKFLQHTVWQWTSEPVFVDSYQQLDLSASMQLNDFCSVFIEAINLTSETTNKYGRNRSQFLEFSEVGPRYALGFRMKI